MIYCCVKSGVLGLTLSAAVDLGPRGIRVNAVAPGSVPTEGVKINVDPEKIRLLIGRALLGRLGTVQDIAGAVAFIANDDSSWVSGECVKVDGTTTTGYL